MTIRVEVVDLRDQGDLEDSLSAETGPSKGMAELAQAVLDAEAIEGAVVVALADETTMAELNRRYRAKQGATDVLAFRYDETEDEWPSASGEEEAIGEVVLCPSVVERYAQEEGVDPGQRLAWSLVHGLLHLAGYDHEQDQGEMAEREAELLNRLSELAAAVHIPPVR